MRQLTLNKFSQPNQMGTAAVDKKGSIFFFFFFLRRGGDSSIRMQLRRQAKYRRTDALGT